MFENPSTQETAMSTFENVAYGLMMGAWLISHGLYALNVISLY